MIVLTPGDERLAFIAPQPVDRTRAEARLDRFPPHVAGALVGQIGPLANLRSSSGCGVRLRTDSPFVELRLARLRHHQPTAVGVALEVEHDDGWRATASLDLREREGDVAVRLATGLERGGPARIVDAWLPLISTCAVAGVAVADGAVVERAEAPTPEWVVLGDSLAQGFCAQDPTQAWVPRVARRAGRACWNLGVGGIRIEPDAFAWALAKPWPQVVVAIGSNHAWRDPDAAALPERAAALLRLLLAGGHGRVLWILPPWKSLEDGLGPAEFQGVALDAAAAERTRRIRADLRALLAPHAARIAVADDLMPHDARLLADGLHPAALGMARYADGVARALGW